VNGMGERAGNAAMASAVAVIHDFAPDIELGIKESSIYTVSKLVETFSGVRISFQQANCWRQCVYADSRDTC